MKALVLSAFLLVAGFFVAPNLFNKREKKAFSDEIRLEEAKEIYRISELSDSVDFVPGRFYKRGGFVEWLLGSNNRKLWQREVSVPVLDLGKKSGGLKPVEFGGGNQTIGIEAKDSLGRIWSIRSVNKDQSKVLSGFWQLSLLRPMVRDQASALNPYASLVTAELAEAIGIYHANPQLYFFPFDSAYGKYNKRMAGRMVMLMEEVDGNWDHSPKFGNAAKILDTEDMWEVAESKNIPIDTVLYVRSRLFDMLISDGDRHEGNWKWALQKGKGHKIIEPIPVDRDMAFYKFGPGVLPNLFLKFKKEFQSFTPDYKSVEGLMEQSLPMDLAILGGLSKEKFVEQAKFIQKQLTDKVIAGAMKNYPPEIYPFVVEEHTRILRQRLEKLPQVAERFYELIQKKTKEKD